MSWRCRRRTTGDEHHEKLVAAGFANVDVEPTRVYDRIAVKETTTGTLNVVLMRMRS